MLKLGILITFFPLLSFSQEVAITIDDSPMAPGVVYTGPERAEQIIKALKKHDVKAVFFSNSVKLKDDESKQRLENYSQAGHYIANHTHSHKHAKKLGAQKYIADIEKADQVLKKYKTFQKWFRFPFLDQAEDHKNRDQIFKWLKEKRYRIGYVTIDTYDWYVHSLLKKAIERKKKVDYQKLKIAYVKNILDCSKIFHEKSQKLFNGPIKHTLLVHENDLLGLYLDDVLDGYKKMGWKIIDPKPAIEQKAFDIQLNTLKNRDGLVIAKESLSNPKAKTIELNSYDYKYLNKEFKFLR